MWCLLYVYLYIFDCAKDTNISRYIYMYSIVGSLYLQIHNHIQGPKKEILTLAISTAKIHVGTKLSWPYME